MTNIKLPSSDSVANFLHNDGWKRFSVRYPHLIGFVSPDSIKDDFGKPIIVSLPSRSGAYNDEALMVSRVIDLLADIKHTTIDNMILMINSLV